EHNDKTSGLFGNVHQVEVFTRVQFSEEELAIIKSRKLKDYVVLKRKPDSRTAKKFDAEYMASIADGYHLRVKDLMKEDADRFTFDTPVDAKVYEENLTAALKQLKSFIVGNAGVAEAKTFEL
ncbi:MAG: hypothetical protein KGI03_03875, partial [Patescibacteria group bacterium]|nr:hypothetical protein [Patescibacteria group bacterium]